MILDFCLSFLWVVHFVSREGSQSKSFLLTETLSCSRRVGRAYSFLWGITCPPESISLSAAIGLYGTALETASVGPFMSEQLGKANMYLPLYVCGLFSFQLCWLEEFNLVSLKFSSVRKAATLSAVRLGLQVWGSWNSSDVNPKKPWTLGLYLFKAVELLVMLSSLHYLCIVFGLDVPTSVKT